MLPVTMARAKHIPPSRLLMSIAYSSLFGGLTTMIDTPPSILVMGPRGYRFRDNTIVGFPLTLVVFVIIMVLVPLVWPLHP